MSDSGVRGFLAVEAAARELLEHKQQHLDLQHAIGGGGGGGGSRRPSAVSVGPVMTVAAAGGGGGGGSNHRNQRAAFLLRKRSSGEEVVVSLQPVGPAVQGARAVIAKVPSFQSSAAVKATCTPPLTSPQIVIDRGGGGGLTATPRKRRSLDDGDVDYVSLLPPADLSRRFSEAADVGADVVAANELQKAYAKYRRRARAASDDAFADSLGGRLGILRDREQHEALCEWVRRDRERRRSCAVGEFASQAAARAKTPVLLHPAGSAGLQSVGSGGSGSLGVPRAQRAHSSVGLRGGGGEFLDAMERRSLRSSSSFNVDESGGGGAGGRGGGRGGGGGNRRASYLPKQYSYDPHHLQKRRSRCGSQSEGASGAKRHSTHGGGQHPRPSASHHSRLHLQHDPTASDLEEAAQRLLHEVAPGHPGLIVNDLHEKSPPEKERRRMALAVSCVALAITVFAALLVGLTLGLSHLLEDLTPGRTNDPQRKKWASRLEARKPSQLVNDCSCKRCKCVGPFLQSSDH